MVKNDVHDHRPEEREAERNKARAEEQAEAAQNLKDCDDLSGVRVSASALRVIKARLFLCDPNGRDFIFRRLHIAIAVGTGHSVQENFIVMKGGKEFTGSNR